MNKYIILIAIFAVIVVILSIPLLADQYASAGMIKKIQFTTNLDFITGFLVKVMKMNRWRLFSLQIMELYILVH